MKRVISILLTIAMLSTIVPTISFAAMGDYSGNITGATWHWPIHGFSSATAAYSKISSSYGYRGAGYNRNHYGVDISASTGTTVYPTRKGTVCLVKDDLSEGQGRTIFINHNDGYYSVYMHLSKIYVSLGETVDINTPIGASGASGYGIETYYPPHLHFGIHYGSSYSYNCNVNPCPTGYTNVGESFQASAGGRPEGSASISYTVNPEIETPPDTEAPTITGLNVKDISGDSFTVECNLNDNVGVTRLWYVLYAPGGEYQFSDSASNGYYSKKLYTKDYGGSGTYSLHLYAFDASENSSGGLSAGSFSVNPATFKADKYIVKPKDNITFTYGNLTLAEEAKIFFSKGGEIYFSDDATKSVNYTTYFNEPGVYSVFVGGRFGSNWTYTESVTIYVTEPTLSVSSSMPRSNENITFHYENLTYASSAMLCFEKNGVIYWSVDVSSSKDYTTYFQSDGEYYVFVRGYYNGSYTDSEKIKISVATPNIVADDCFIYTENAVTFTYSNLSYASLVNLYVKKNNEIYLTEDITSSRNYEMIFEEEGLYSVYAGGYYNGSWQYTNTIYIYVATPLIESNVSHIQKNDTLTFKYSGLTYANAVALCFEKNGEVYWREDVTDNREFTTHFQSDGEYTVFVRGVFGDDILESNKIKIIVGAPEIKLNKLSSILGEELTLEYSGFQYANNVMLRIEKAGVVFKEIDITSSKVNLFAVDEIGDYSVYAIGTFSNNVKRESNKVSFTVKDLPTKYTDSLVKLNSNKDLSVSVELYNINESCEVIVAAYKGNSFVTCTITPYNLETINTTLTGDIDKIKVMVWKNLSNLMPLCEAKVIPSSEFILE